MTAKGELHVEMLSKELQSILKNYATLTLQKGREKIRCELSGHEMPCNYETVKSYISGKKFQRLLAQENFDYEKYKQHIIPSTKRGRKHQLFCLLTLRHLNNLPHHIKSHVEGRRFIKAFRRWEECQRTGEVFKPLTGKRKLEENTISHPDEADSDDEESDTDSLSDLYPAADFQDDDDDDDDDEEDMDDSGLNVDSKHMKNNGRVSIDPQSDSDFEFESLEEEPEVASKYSNASGKTESNKNKLKKRKKLKQIKEKK